ncbi:DUF488 domain-containing protein [Rhizobium leguminosarum]|uniref:DUF488 domain-containing protein n=1 Tax=Rhizobium leguminosarum TaxID=384 RepID=UPI0010315565|nr:DUF488 domain-containing protein [Rhizobium leguminosarum]TAU35268.1 DUF488 domain-containing protein [Rhizobium leguminosarum]
MLGFQPFFTIGHSTRTILQFVELLRVGQVEIVADIRSIRKSRRNPQFNESNLRAELSAYQIDYEVIDRLGGRRPKQKDIDDGLNSWWVNRSFHNYADYALSERYKEGLATLLEFGRRRRCAVMCAEALWWRCHRRIVADYLLSKGMEVFHLLGQGTIVRAELTPGAIPCENGGLIYPKKS